VPPRQAPAEGYRGRRRVPQPARSRYVAVVTTAVVGAGVVALGAGAAIPDAKLGTPYASGDATTLAMSVEDRQAALDRASRTDDRAGPAVSVEQDAPDVWLLPLHQYTLTTLFEMRWGEMHTGVDMAIGYGTPYMAAHAGTVILARYNGGFGYNIQIDHGNGIITVYGHSSKLLVHEGQHVEAGQVIGLIGNTGYSFGNHLHFEVHINGVAVDPIPFMLQRGVDILKRLEAAKGGIVIS
jgi:murein DD-endopeptidase MepM/ murein hydrolase activator NlpD